MGTWGYGIFDDDTACDIAGDYRELVEGGVDDDEAWRRVADAFPYPDESDRSVLWLALAATQVQRHTLDDTVRRRALAVIDGPDDQTWVDAGEEELRRRRAVLADLRTALLDPQSSSAAPPTADDTAARSSVGRRRWWRRR